MSATPDYIFSPTDIDLDRLSSIEIAGIEVTKSANSGDNKDKSGWPLCKCGLEIGTPVVFWEPVMLSEVVSKAFTSPLLGNKLEKLKKIKGGSFKSNSFYHVHLYDFFPANALQGLHPILAFIPSDLKYMFLSCLDGAGKDTARIRYLSETDITQTVPLLSHILTPEIASLTVSGSVEATIASCTADSAYSLKHGRGADSIYFCSGTRSFLFPLSGHTNRVQRSLEDALLNLERSIFKMHRRTAFSGEKLGTCSEKSGCSYQLNFTPRKSQYAFQLLYPKPNHPLTLNFGQKAPSNASVGLKQSDENYVFLIWRKRYCCATRRSQLQIGD